MIDLEVLTRPLTEAAPCGPDLDADGDPDYMNLMARIEGNLPASFFEFDRAAVDGKSDAAALRGLLERSLDLRPVVTLAKLAILDRSLESFADWLDLLDTLLSRYWADVHPSVGAGQGALRSAILQTLDDLPTVVLPLQYAPLVDSRRSGPISFRSYLAAFGEVARREGEPELDTAAIESAMDSAPIEDVVSARDLLARITRSVEGIRKTWIAEAGFDDAPKLERLGGLSGRMLAFLEGEVARRAPDAALEQADASTDVDGSEARVPAATSGVARIESAAMAAEALAAIAAYLWLAEPSSPALLLVSQAQQLVGRNFVEIVRLVMPDLLEDARITIGREPQVVFKVERLPTVPFDETAADGEVEMEESTAQAPAISVASRQGVQQLLGEIAAFYRVAEPSNPIPLLCDRARGLCSLDFLTLMRDMLSSDR